LALFSIGRHIVPLRFFDLDLISSDAMGLRMHTRFNSAGQPTLPPPPLHKATVSQFKGFNTLTGHGPMLVVDPVNNSSFQSSAQLFVTTAWVL
jgi:hypothetical protein